MLKIRHTPDDEFLGENESIACCSRIIFFKLLFCCVVNSMFGGREEKSITKQSMSIGVKCCQIWIGLVSGIRLLNGHEILL